jgi:hypothetical protein
MRLRGLDGGGGHGIANECTDGSADKIAQLRTY